MKICSLYSGSTGNSTLISDGNTNILVDIGKNCKQTLLSLEKMNLQKNDINAIFLTHEHGDHIKGLKVFCKNLDIPVYGKQGSLDYIYDNEHCNALTNLNSIDDKGIEIGNLFINPFDTYHDSKASCGYTIENGSKKIGVATDLGKATDDVFNALKGSSAILLESNYDETMLMMGGYPQFLKQRIKSDYGHLSNIECGKLVKKLFENGTENFLLGHLSQENNMPVLALQTVKCEISDKRILEKISLEVVGRDLISTTIEV